MNLIGTLSAPRSLRTQLTLGAALVTLVIVGLSGVVIAIRIHGQDLLQVDRHLSARADKVGADAGKVLSEQGDHDGPRAGAGRDAGGLLAGSQSLTRVFSSGMVISQDGDIPAMAIPAPGGIGYSTVTIGDQQWRSLVRPITGGQVQVLDSLAPVDQRLRDNEQVIAVVAASATLLTAFGVWAIAGLVLTPLQELRSGAARIRSGHDLDRRLPSVARPQEIAELSHTLDEMLDRLQHSTLATRQFTADVGHELRTPLTGLGIDLESLRRNPDLPADQRAEMLDAMTVEHTRIVELLDGLQSLARGDARALPARSRVDIAELVQESVARARSRHARSHFNLHTELRSIPLVDGWREGLQLAIGNLLDNAAVHGRVDGNVEVTLSAPDKTVILTVTDDGPGIPAELRDRMRERFVRGPHTRGVGSGLGLALVDQQVALHGGTLTLNGPSSGGLLATLRLPTQHQDSC